ncbi:SRPBCC family protein [Mycolicibacterium arenosum]|uniref:SRPBCC family protein n=1 Tax=Mycolicibacterium arenosum TaxID=2952157 RepID=A0ABT1LWK6_9MYCO|nr:SRPBCC family protein [Mycolicibacterium sp. CAU 1645]MCP9271279.1 SRPBCC family protein [Mycolicibacterium sp. CAU 1645]
MSTDTISVRITVAAPAERVFEILADPSTHQAIDGTGWVRESLDGQPLTAVGQHFRIAMYHDNHPDGDYEMTNTVRVYESPRAIAWEPGQAEADGAIGYGGWIWRYDVTPVSEGVEVTLTYDWSAVPAELRQHIEFPPFGPDHLENSLSHLAMLATD